MKNQASDREAARRKRAQQAATPALRPLQRKPGSTQSRCEGERSRQGRRFGVGASAAIGFKHVIQTGYRLLTHKGLAGKPIWLLSLVAVLISFLAGQGLGLLLAGLHQLPAHLSPNLDFGNSQPGITIRPTVSPLPDAKEVWNCEVVVIGGSLGGVAAASHAMQSGATTCLIELTPWLGGQISSQGVSALDESQVMRSQESFSQSWESFKHLIIQRPVKLPAWTKVTNEKRVNDLNSCWVGTLCFPPQVGASASEQLLKNSAAKAPNSRWATATAFKGADFDPTGHKITAVYAVRRVVHKQNYLPQGRFSAELKQWYAWNSDAEFEKIPIRLQPPPGKRFMVIDATDSTEFVGWARVPYRLGSESLATTGERNASRKDNEDCTQAFTYPFAMAIRDDQGASIKALSRFESDYPKEEHRSDFDLQGFPVFSGRSFFNYRRIVSMAQDDPYEATPVLGDITAVNWNRGNDWKFMDPPLILADASIDQSGQRQNWLGGMSVTALRHGENHAFLFAHWLLEKHSSEMPFAYLWGADSPMGTSTGLSMVPYLREGRRIVGRRAYDQRDFAIREADLRIDMQEGRDFSPTAIARMHYSIDIHGCRYRNSKHDGEAASASVGETNVRPIFLPLEALIPQGVDNLLIGGKGIAVTHIANGMTRIHQGEWSIGAVAGATAGWLTTHAPANVQPAEIVPKHLLPKLREHLTKQGLGMAWKSLQS